MASMLLRTSCSRSCISARMAACVGDVRPASRCCASDADDAAGSGPRYSETSRPASRISAPRLRRCTSTSRCPVRDRSQMYSGTVGEAPGYLQVGVLEDVRRVDATAQAAIEAKPDHLAQAVAVVGEQRGQSLLIALFRPPQ